MGVAGVDVIWFCRQLCTVITEQSTWWLQCGSVHIWRFSYCDSNPRLVAYMLFVITYVSNINLYRNLDNHFEWYFETKHYTFYPDVFHCCLIRMECTMSCHGNHSFMIGRKCEGNPPVTFDSIKKVTNEELVPCLTELLNEKTAGLIVRRAFVCRQCNITLKRPCVVKWLQSTLEKDVRGMNMWTSLQWYTTLCYLLIAMQPTQQT